MTNKWKYFRGWLIAINICTLILGILMIARPQTSALVLCWLLGLLSLGTGIYEMVRYFKLGLAGLFFRFDLALGVGNIILGILFLTHPTGAMTVLPFLVGIELLAGSVFDVQLAISLRRYKMGSWGTSLALGILGVVLAIFLFADPFHGAAALMAFMGIALIINSVQGFYTIVCLSKALKTAEGPKVIEANWTPVE